MNSTPHFLICPPRTGSNFLQALLTCITKLPNNATYSNGIERPHFFLTIKSHAISYMHLLNEISSFMPCYNLFPYKFIVLWRDPRLSIISSYEYSKHRDGIEVEQDDFLDCPCPLPVFGLERRTYLENYKCFVMNWYLDSRFESNILHLKYEDLISNPSKTVELILGFMGIEYIADKLIGVSEALRDISFSLEKRWQNIVNDRKEYEAVFHVSMLKLKQYKSEFNHINDYQVLISSINRSLSYEILKLGYDSEAIGTSGLQGKDTNQSNTAV